MDLDLGKKNDFIYFSRQNNIPILPTQLFKKGECFLKDQIQLEYPIILKRSKDQWHVNYVVDDACQLESTLNKFFQKIGYSEEFQIQKYLSYIRNDDIRYYCATFEISPSVNQFILISEQIVDLYAIHNNIKTSHLGNRNSYLISELMDRAVNHMNNIVSFFSQSRYEGHIGIDFLVSGNEIYFLELNKRKNRTTYLYFLLKEHSIDINDNHFIYIKKELHELVFHNSDLAEIFKDKNYVLIISPEAKLLDPLNDKINRIVRSDVENCRWRDELYYI